MSERKPVSKRAYIGCDLAQSKDRTVLFSDGHAITFESGAMIAIGAHPGEGYRGREIRVDVYVEVPNEQT